jgi:hypothetical protein
VKRVTLEITYDSTKDAVALLFAVLMGNRAVKVHTVRRRGEIRSVSRKAAKS